MKEPTFVYHGQKWVLPVFRAKSSKNKQIRADRKKLDRWADKLLDTGKRNKAFWKKYERYGWDGVYAEAKANG